MTEMTGILMDGKMSFGVRRMARTPAIKMKIANTMKVYGLRSARLTIHIAYSPAASCKSADFAPSPPLAMSAKADFAHRSLSLRWPRRIEAVAGIENNIGFLPQKDMFYDYRSFSRSLKCYTGINLIPFQYGSP
jgi:hypothetical protein